MCQKLLRGKTVGPFFPDTLYEPLQKVVFLLLRRKLKCCIISVSHTVLSRRYVKCYPREQNVFMRINAHATTRINAALNDNFIYRVAQITQAALFYGL